MSLKGTQRKENAGTNLTIWYAALMQRFHRFVTRMWQSSFFNPYYPQYPQPQPLLNGTIGYLQQYKPEEYQQEFAAIGQPYQQHGPPAYPDDRSSGIGNVFEVMSGANLYFGYGNGNQSEALYRRFYSTCDRQWQPVSTASLADRCDTNAKQSTFTSTADAIEEMADIRKLGHFSASSKRQMENDDMKAGESVRKKPACPVKPSGGLSISNRDKPRESSPIAGCSKAGFLSGAATDNSEKNIEDKKKDHMTAVTANAQKRPGPSTVTNDHSQLVQARKGHPSPLRHRSWKYTAYGNEVREQGAKRGYLQFSCASYNILAQNLLCDHTELYCRTDPAFLQWEYRSANLLSEIEESMPDILCLQEVNETHFHEFFLPNMQKLGYKGIFKKRTGHMKDGCVICFRTEQFELDDVTAVEYFHPGVPVLDRDNIGLILRLRTVKKKHKGHKLCVATTHLLFNPRRGDVKLAQLMNLFAEIDEIAYKSHSKPWKPNYYPVILCGDFNTEPHSDLYKFLCRGSLSYEGKLCRKMSGQREDRGGRDVYLKKSFLSPELGITDQCQYISVFKDRLDKYDKHLEAKRKKILRELKEEEESGLGVSADNDNISDKATVDPSDINPSVELASATGEQPPQHSPAHSNVENATDDAAQCYYTQNSGRVSHSLNLHSVYSHGGRGQSEVTTTHTKASCTVDYIMYSVQKKHTRTRRDHMSVKDVTEGKLHLLATKQLPTDKDMYKLGPLPNKAISSDHVMLMAKFLLKIK